MKTIGIDISVLNDKQKTGIGVYTYELIKALLKVNKKDKFILFGVATISTYNYLKNLEFKNYPNVEMKIFRIPAKFFRIGFLTWQKLNWPKIEKLIGPVDIFHSFNWFMPPQKSGKRVTTIFDLTSILFPEWHDARTTQMDKMRFKKIAGNADLILAISKNTKDDFMKFNPKGRVEVVYPGVRDCFSLDFARDRNDNKEVGRVLGKYGLKSGYLLSVGTLEPRKNLETLINAFLESKMLAPLVLVGKSGWKNEQLLSLITKYPQNIIQLGFVPDKDLKILYQQALCFVYPSFYEGFGIPVLEAMKCGTPVITSNTSSLPEVGGEAVLYVDPKNMEELARGIRKIGESREIREKMIKEGLEQAKKFSWEQSARKLNDLYQEL